MARDEERMLRAQQAPIMGGLPEVPGVGVALSLTPGLGVHLRGLADELLVNNLPGATVRRDQRETRATAVSAANDCFSCMDSHGAFATLELAPLLEEVKRGSSEGFDSKMQAPLRIAWTIRRGPLALTAADVEAAHGAGATDGGVQLTEPIASPFSRYNRLGDGSRARTPPTPEVYRERAAVIAQNGYSAPSAIQAPLRG